MPREQHAKKIDHLEHRHKAVLEKFGSLEPANSVFWRSKWTTTPQQLQFLESLIEQLEATHSVAHATAQNLNLAVGVVVAANTPG
jgi:flagellar biosynthesis chaperone FliJ